MPEGRLRPRELAPIDEFGLSALPGDRRGSGSATAFETKMLATKRARRYAARRRGSNFLISGPRRNRITKLGAAAAAQPGFSWTLDFPDAGPICFQVS
jgi:hypothetical protein